MGYKEIFNGRKKEYQEERKEGRRKKKREGEKEEKVSRLRKLKSYVIWYRGNLRK